MNRPTKLKRTQERNYSAHHMLIETARVANERAAKQEMGWSYDALTAILFSALAVEALANAFGERKVENWADFESSSPNAKLRVVAAAMKIPYDNELDLWAKIKWLVKFRNLVAHAKPKLIKEELMLTQEEVDKRLFDRPESKVESEITVANAEKAVRAVRYLKDILCAALPPEDFMGLATDSWSGSTTLHDGA